MDPKSLKRHQSGHEDNKKPFKCEHCGKAFGRRHVLKEHENIHSNIFNYRCEDCSFKTKHARSLRAHLLAKDHEAGFVQKPNGNVRRICKREMPYSTRKPNPLKCKFKNCNHVSASKYDFYEHKKTHIPPDKQKLCKFCNFVTTYPHNLKTHQSHHEGNSRSFQCETCSNFFHSFSGLKRHLASTHSDISRYRYKDCTFTSKHKGSLSRHLKRKKHEADVMVEPDETVEDFIVDSTRQEWTVMRSPSQSVPSELNSAARETSSKH